MTWLWHLALRTLALLSLVPHHLLAQGQGIQLGPELRISRAYDLTYVFQGAIGPGGVLAVSQPADHKVLLFDLSRRDTPYSSVGRRGDGPGEFLAIGPMGWLGDSLWIGDRSRPRVEFFRRDGKHIISKTFEPPSLPGLPARYGTPYAVLKGGVVAYYPNVVPSTIGKAAGRPESTFQFLLATASGKNPQSLAELKLSGSEFVVRGDRGSSTGTQPFLASEFVQVVPGGGRITLVRELPEDNAGGPISVTTYHASGTQAEKWAVKLPRRLVTDSEWDSVLTRRADVYADVWSTKAAAKAALRDVLARPKFHPLVTAVVVSEDGSTWLRLDRPASPTQAEWLVFTPEGRQVGSVQIGREVRILAVSPKGLLGVRLDVDGVPQLFWRTLRSGKP